MAVDDIVKKVAMFLVGFTMLAPLRLAMTCAKFSIKRFQLPVERVGLFINITKNNIELAGFIAVLIGNIIIWCNKDNKELPKICSLFTNWLMFVMSIMSLVAYKSGGDSGNLNFYFWTIVFYAFMYRINYIFSVKVDVNNVSYNFVGRPLFSIFVSVYHNIFLYFANKYEMDNVEYWIVYGQMVIVIIFTCATALLWTYSTYSEPITIVAQCFYEAFFGGSGSQPVSSSQEQAQSSKCCCCCCKKCKKGRSCSCNNETPNCDLCKVAKLICCLCKDETQCGKCLSELPTAIGQLSNCDNGDSLKCTCNCSEKIDCCRIKRFTEFCKALCCHLKNGKCFCKSKVKIIRIRMCCKAKSNGQLCICYKWCHKTAVEPCKCCGGGTGSCLTDGCGIVNVLKCLFGNETCQSTCGTKDGKLCSCILTVFSKVKCTLTTKVCEKCCPCITNNECNIKCACALCWRRFFRCYIICGGKCKQQEDGEGCKCCCVGEQGCDENQYTCCTTSPEPSTQCLCHTDQLCCCCCKNCEQSCKRSCTTASAGGQGCTCCTAGNCCCCCENCSKPNPNDYICLFTQIVYVFLRILSSFSEAICGCSQPSVQCSSTEEEPLCRCCCCKSPEDSCCCPGHQQVEENECECCCCKGEESTKKKNCDNDSSSDGKGSIWDEFKKPLLWSPAMIYIFANGTLYSVYPGVSPYQLVSADVGYKIGLIILLLSPIIPIAICILDMESIKKGPSKKWENGYVGWHALWAGPIYAIICIILSFYTLHYPESMIGRNIYGNNVLVGLLTVSYVVVQEGLKSVGPTSTKSQVNCEIHKGTVTTIIYLISLVLSNVSGFIGDGYLRTFRKYSRDNWPTKGYTRYRGFKFWLGSACKAAGKSILNAFNSDIRARIESFS